MLYRFALCLCLLGSPLHAASDKSDEEREISGTSELGWTTTSGNTETVSIDGKVDVLQNLENWENNLVLSTLFQQSEEDIENDAGDIIRTETVTKEHKSFASLKNSYKLNKQHSKLFLFTSYQRNRFSGFDYQATVSLGYSTRLFKTEKQSLKADIGPSYQQNKVTSFEGGDKTSTIENSAGVRVAANYVYAFNKNAKFTQNLSSNISLDSDGNTATRSETAIITQINGSLSLKASFTVDHNSNPPDDKVNADTQTSAKIVYSF